VDVGTPLVVSMTPSRSGTLLLLVVALDNDNRTLPTPAGWTLRYTASGNGAGGNLARIYWFHRVSAAGVALSLTPSGACTAYAVLTEWAAYDGLQPVPSAVGGAVWQGAAPPSFNVRNGTAAVVPTADGTMVTLVFSQPAVRGYSVVSGGVAVDSVVSSGELLLAYKPGVTVGSEPDMLIGTSSSGVHLISSLMVSDGLAGVADRIRSHVREDAGSIFAATQAIAVELGISEAFDYGEGVPAGVLRPFSEALTPELVALRYHPLPTRNQEMLVTVDGETNLGRMASTIPEALMLPASSIPGESGGLVTAQRAIQHVVDTWSSAYPWLQFEPIPDLRFVEPGAVGNERQFYLDNASAGVLTTAAVVIPQEQDARRSLREILDEWLSIFPGTIVRQTSLGTIELVPRVGPDAPEDVTLTLTWDDLLAISDGEDDPRGVINRCRVTSQGWEFTENQALRAPAFVVSIGGLGIERSVLDSEEVLPDDTAEEFQSGRTIPFTVLVDGGNTITVDVVLTAFGSWNRSTASSFGVEGTHSASLTLSVGQSQQVSITHNSRSQNVTATWRVTRVSSVAIDVEPLTIPSWADNLFGRTYFAYLFEVDVTGTAWVRTNEAVTSEFGRADQVLPGPGGTDALVTSRAAYGERQASIQSNVFQLTPEQTQNVAQSYVLWNINPRTVRDVQQSEWERYPVKFDHIGRLLQLPNGEVAVAENRDYTDAFQPLGGAMSSTFSATVTEVVIDTETDWLLLDSGNFMQLDSGEMVEVS
jgi:hypothetical protein